MFRRMVISFTFLCAATLSHLVRAQVPPGAIDPNQTPEQQAMIDQMQQMRQQVMQNMQDKGIDPQQFFQNLRQQMQDGTFDPAQFQQQLVNQGLLDPTMVTKMQETAHKATYAGIKRQLEATDEEWAVLEPKIGKLLDATAALGQAGQRGGGMRGMAGFLNPQASTSPVAKAMNELRAAVKEPTTGADTIAMKLAALREAKERAKIELKFAQKDLTDILTVRQEAILETAGVLQSTN